MVRNNASSNSDDRHAVTEILAAMEELRWQNEVLQGDMQKLQQGQ